MTTIERSFNEIFTTVRKASVGAGCPFGMAEDIGRAAVWLHRNGIAGTEAALAALEDVPQGSALPAADGSVLVFRDARAAVCATGAIDMLVAGSVREIGLRNTDAPMLVVGLAGARAVQDDLSFRLVVGGAVVAVDGSARGLDSLTVSPGMDLNIALADGQTDRVPESQPTAPARVDEVAWSRCEQLARRTYVPATEESRLKGAGGSHTDND